MRRWLLLIAAAALLVVGAVGGWFASRETRDPDVVVETATVTETHTVQAPEPGLPESVALTRDALLDAARGRDYDALRPLIPATGFEYTFGDPVPGGPIAYWQELERTTDERPLERLEQVLEMPYTLSRGIFVWPFAYDVASLDDLTAYEREVLAPLGPLETVFVEGTGYLSWRAGIRPDGTWVFFVAGD
jgi:hypothetical protein